MKRRKRRAFLRLTREEVLEVCLYFAQGMGFIDGKWFGTYKDWPALLRTLDCAMDRTLIERLLTEVRSVSTS